MRNIKLALVQFDVPSFSPVYSLDTCQVLPQGLGL
jgi:hypothetical protein